MQEKFNIGDQVWYQDEGSGKISDGLILRATNKFCILDLGRGNTKRKAKHLLEKTEDEAMLKTILKINKVVEDQFKLNINDLHKMFTKMLEKYPEKFV